MSSVAILAQAILAQAFWLSFAVALRCAPRHAITQLMRVRIGRLVIHVGVILLGPLPHRSRDHPKGCSGGGHPPVAIFVLGGCTIFHIFFSAMAPNQKKNAGWTFINGNWSKKHGQGKFTYVLQERSFPTQPLHCVVVGVLVLPSLFGIIVRHTRFGRTPTPPPPPPPLPLHTHTGVARSRQSHLP